MVRKGIEHIEFYFNFRKGGLIEKIYDYITFKIKRKTYKRYLNTYNSLTEIQKIIYKNVIELIRTKNTKLSIEPKSGALYIHNDDVFCKILYNRIEIAHGWKYEEERSYYYDSYFPDIILDRLKNKFYDKAEYLRLKLEDEILSGLRKNLHNMHNQMYILNRKKL